MVGWFRRGSKGVFRPIRSPHNPSTVSLWKTAPGGPDTPLSGLFERFEEVGQLLVELAVLVTKFLDLLDRVDDCRMMLTAKAAAYFRQ